MNANEMSRQTYIKLFTQTKQTLIIDKYFYYFNSLNNNQNNLLPKNIKCLKVHQVKKK